MRKYLLFSIIVFFALWVLSSATAQAATYYVDNSCTYSGTGATQTCAGAGGSGPIKTIAEVNDLRWTAPFAAGDFLLFKGGLTWNEATALNINSLTATAGNPFTVSSYGAGKAIIQPSGNLNAVEMPNSSGIVISNLILIGSGKATSTMSGVAYWTNSASDVTDLVFTGLEISQFQMGISLQATTLGINNVSITYNTIYNCSSFGIISLQDASSMLHENWYIGYNTIYNITGENSGAAIGVLIQYLNGGTVEHNEVYGGGTLITSFSAGGSFQTSYSNAITIQYNSAHDNSLGSGTLDACAYDLDVGTSNSIVQYNYSYNNDGQALTVTQLTSSVPWSNNVFRYNISWNDVKKNSLGVISLFDNTTTHNISGGYFYNNTIYLDQITSGTPKAVYFNNAMNDFTFKNNIFVATGGKQLLSIVAGSTNIVMDYNNWYSNGLSMDWNGTNYTTWSTWKTASGQDTHSINSDPKFVSTSDFNLQTESPCINTGANVGLTRDYIGTIVPQGISPDIGAYESIIIDITPPAAPMGVAVN